MSEPNSSESIATADLRLFETGNFADATVVCSNRTWKVHKLILGSRCKWFRAAFYGNMAEAISGTVVLEEQDPDLVDLLLRFIYDKPFRIADFFLLDDLKQEAMEALRLRLDDDLDDEAMREDMRDAKILSAKTGKGQSPKWLRAIFDALEDAYKDRSTEPIRATLIEFVYTNRDTIFLFKDAEASMDKIPEIGRDLMKKDIINRHAEPKPQLGLRVVSAVRSVLPDGSKGRVVFSNDEPCVLYPRECGYNGDGPRVFLPVDLLTGKDHVDGLTWLSPGPGGVHQVTSHPDSTICQLRMNQSYGGVFDVLYISFQHCNDSALFVEHYRRHKPTLRANTAPSSESLSLCMKSQISRKE